VHASLPIVLKCAQVITEAPKGAKSPLASTPCECHYRGTLIDGTEFDSSYKRGKPTTFAPNQVVKG
jgi:FKBP-type peptidyl-prolyl cis-trans isomerase FklB